EDLKELLPENSTKLEMIGMVIYAANRIQPRVSKYMDYSFETQNKLLDYFLQLEIDSKIIERFKYILESKVIIFNRPANLYAISLILNSDLKLDIEKSTRDTLDYRAFLKFYLGCNEAVVSIQNNDRSDRSKIEKLSANFI